MRVVAGIDPGTKGALVILADGEVEQIWRLTNATPADVIAVIDEVQATYGTPAVCAVEDIRVHAGLPGGKAQLYRQGHNRGVLVGCVAAVRWPVVEVLPRAWQSTYLGVTADKATHIAAAQRLWPSRTWLKSHDGDADAALIARWAWLTQTVQVQTEVAS